MRVLLIAVGFVAWLSMRATTDSPIDYPCLRDPGGDGSLLNHVRDLVTESPTLKLAHETRVGDSLPLLEANQVRVVDEDDVCRQAVRAVNALPAPEDPSVPPYVTTRVLVLRAGTVYIVQDPERKAGEWTPAYVFDRKFKRLLHIFLT